VLKDFRGAAEFNATVILKAGSSVIEPRTATHPGTPAADVKLTWATFEDACIQAGASRKYGGIHWWDGDFYATTSARSSARAPTPGPRKSGKAANSS
jgi:hypothetical protein